jgi:hypothetical protein
MHTEIIQEIIQRRHCFLYLNIYRNTVLEWLRWGAMGSSVNIMPHYRLDARGLIPGKGRGFFSSLHVQTSSGVYPATYPAGTRCPFLGGKARQGRNPDNSPPASTKIKNEYESHHHFPLPPAFCSGTAFFTFYFYLNKYSPIICIRTSDVLLWKLEWTFWS